MNDTAIKTLMLAVIRQGVKDACKQSEESEEALQWVKENCLFILRGIGYKSIIINEWLSDLEQGKVKVGRFEA